jgi:hypothetical protein
MLGACPETRARIDRVIELAAGFDSMYGMELLATVHWVTTHHPDPARTVKDVVGLVHSWSPRKGRLFTQRHVAVALGHLDDLGWTPTRRAATVGA